MYKIHFHLLNTMDISFYNLVSIIPKWRSNIIDKYIDAGCDENLLFYFIHGERIYSRNNQDFLKIQDGDILFAPVKSRYISRVSSSSPNDLASGICIKFDIKDAKGNDIIIDDPPQLIVHDTDGYFYNSFTKLHDIIMQGTREKLYSKALLSKLLDTLIANVRKEKTFSSSFRTIYPAVVKIERYPQEQISVTELANLCFISESTFRRQFNQYAGTSPANYRNKIRIQKAIELLESGIYSIEKTAEVMGFTDQAHLCKIIKKETGKTPKDIIRNSKNI